MAVQLVNKSSDIGYESAMKSVVLVFYPTVIILNYVVSAKLNYNFPTNYIEVHRNVNDQPETFSFSKLLLFMILLIHYNTFKKSSGYL